MADEASARPLREYTTAELSACLAHAEALTDGKLSACVPLRLRPPLDSWAADMRSEREDRQRLRAEARDRASGRHQ